MDFTTFNPMKFDQLKTQLEGDLFIDNVQRILYSTDASQYKEMPVAVTKPKSKEDIKKIIAFAAGNNTSIIPRGGGTSLAGQVVGSGIVVDISKYMNQILELTLKNTSICPAVSFIFEELKNPTRI